MRADHQEKTGIIQPFRRSAPEGASLSWDAQDRPAALERAQARDVDLVIVGGGITGAGLAREAALRGIPFLLVDQADFAFGTSSRSSKLVHGGLRYLAQGEFRLVREATTERNWLCSALPNLVRPLGFYFCARRGGKDTPLRVRVALWLYDLLGNTGSRYKLARSRILTPAELKAREPGLDTTGLLLAGRYLDAAVDDARLTLEVLKEARDRSGGLCQALNYVAATKVLMEHGRVRGVQLTDRLGGGTFTVATRCLVSAAGPWTEQVQELAGLNTAQLRPTKGVHLTIPNTRLGLRDAFVLRSVDDGRSFFALPRGDLTLIGTTDTDYGGDPAQPVCTRADRDYLLRSVNAAFPQARLTPADIVSTYAGIRPLVKQEGIAASSVSRRHTIQDPGTGLVTILGGKLTTFRLMAWEVLSLCARQGYLRPLRGCARQRHFSRLPFRAGLTWESFTRAMGEQGLAGLVPDSMQHHLHQQYGQGALGILAEIKAEPDSGRPLLACQPYCPAEVQHVLAFENAPTLQDVMLRRTEMALTVPPQGQPELAGKVAAIMGCYYAWEADRVRLETTRYLDQVRTTLDLGRDDHD